MSTSLDIQKIYVGLLGRAADSEGLAYWTAEIDGGVLTLEQLRANIVNEQAEYTSTFSGLSRAQTVNQLYNNLFGRDADSEGLTYWTSGGGASVNADQLVLALRDGASTSDQLIMDNRASAADYYTTNLGAAGTFSTDAAAAAVADVDASLASLNASKASTDAGGSSSGSTFTLTTGVDAISGTSGNDTVTGTAGGTDPTITAGDSVTGGAGEDIFAITATGAAAVTVAGVSLSGVETVRVSDTTTGANATTVNLAGQSGVTTLESFGSAQANNVNFSNVNAIADLSLSNTSGAGTHTITYTDAAVEGSADTQNVTLTSATNTGVTTIAGVETVAITASGESSTDLVVADAETVTVSASDDTTVTLSNAANTSLTAVTGSGEGDITFVVDFDLEEMTVTGGAGADTIDISAGVVGATDTVDGGDGSDTLLFQSTAAAVASVAADDATISNIEVLELEADDGGNDTAFTIDLDTVEGVTSIVLDANDADAANSFTLNDINATQLAAITAQVAAGGATIVLDAKDGTGTADAAVINAALGDTAGTLTVTDSNNNIESLTINATGDNDQTIAITNGDFTGSTSADATLTITGGGADRDMTITGNLSSDTVDFSEVLSDVTATFAAAGHTITGGVGDDTFNMGTTFGSTDTIDGGDGDDTVVLTPATSIARPGTMSNVETLQLGATAAVTIAATNISGVSTIALSNAAGLNGNVVTLQNLTGITTISHDVADAAAADGADDGNGITITNGFTGTADSLTLSMDNAGDNAGASVLGAMNFAGLETLTVSVTGGSDNDDATVGGITASGLTTLTVTSSGFTGAGADAANIILGTVSDGSNDEMTSFTASSSLTGVSATLADMGAASTIVGSDFTDTIILTGSTGDDLSLDSGDGDDQITLASGTDRVLITTGTGDADIFFAGGDDHTITLGTGANVLDFDGAGAPGETTGITVTGFGSDDDVRADGASDGGLVVHAVAGGSALTLAGDRFYVSTMDASTADQLVDGVDATTAIADFTDVATTGDVAIALEALFAGDTTGVRTSTIALNDGTNSYLYAFTLDASEDLTALSLLGTIEDYVFNSTNALL